ncbi:class I SAM-dependent methyltransferase [Candidatus Uabimicrobium sp. HlEnr_7]|uniref:class I SAM-dependent DNA methyltransferase n=1 Tax=Candidatus Uabimicrobium helgolandensis TaxID=3095367 RepID=UPI0035569F23
MGAPSHNEVDFYDVCVSFLHDLPLYERVFTPSEDPLLELATGTGRLAIELAAKKHHMIALDISQAMLDKGQEKCPLNLQKYIQWQKDDMTKFNLPRKISGVFIAANSFLLLPSITHQKICLQNISKHLTSGAKLVIDVFHPFYLLKQPQCQGQLSLLMCIENYKENTTLNHWCSGRYDSARQVLIANNIIELCCDGEVKRYPYTEILRYVHRYEMELLLEQANFTVENVFGWYDERPFEHTSQKMIFIARKN